MSNGQDHHPRQGPFRDTGNNRINRDRSRSPIPTSNSDSEKFDEFFPEFRGRGTFKTLNEALYWLYHMIHFIEKRANPFKSTSDDKNNLDSSGSSSPASDSEEEDIVQFNFGSVFRELHDIVSFFYKLIRFADERVNRSKDSGHNRSNTHRRNPFSATYSFSEDIIVESDFRYIFDDLFKILADFDYMISVIENRWNGVKGPNKDRSGIPMPASYSLSESDDDIIVEFDSRCVFEDLKNIVLSLYRLIELIEDKFFPPRVLTREIICSVPLMKFKDLHGNAIFNASVCVFCLQEFKADSVVRKMLCNHVFHKKCSDFWFKYNIRCPICQTYVVKE